MLRREKVTAMVRYILICGDKSGERLDDDVLTLGSNSAPGTTYVWV